MIDTKRSLAQLHPTAYDVPILIFLSLSLLIWGIQTPIITLKELGIWTHTFSVITGIQNLYKEHYYGLAVIIFLFSLIFPFSKLLSLLFLWILKLTDKKRLFFIRWLETLGKWSMLDVFVVAVTIVISKISFLAKAEAHIGIYIFGGSIFLSMITAMRMEHLTRISSRPQRSGSP